LRIAATIVVERDTHKAMVIGDKGERIKRIGMETRVELEKLADAKVFLELWVKVRSGWADDEARVRSSVRIRVVRARVSRGHQTHFRRTRVCAAPL
jgi:GTPase Era involved in 16S rRNA processing